MPAVPLAAVGAERKLNIWKHWAHCSGIFFNDNASVVLPLVFNGILVLPPASAFRERAVGRRHLPL